MAYYVFKSGVVPTITVTYVIDVSMTGYIGSDGVLWNHYDTLPWQQNAIDPERATISITASNSGVSQSGSHGVRYYPSFGQFNRKIGVFDNNLPPVSNLPDDIVQRVTWACPGNFTTITYPLGLSTNFDTVEMMCIGDYTTSDVYSDLVNVTDTGYTSRFVASDGWDFCLRSNTNNGNFANANMGVLFFPYPNPYPAGYSPDIGGFEPYIYGSEAYTTGGHTTNVQTALHGSDESRSPWGLDISKSMIGTSANLDLTGQTRNMVGTMGINKTSNLLCQVNTTGVPEVDFYGGYRSALACVKTVMGGVTWDVIPWGYQKAVTRSAKLTRTFSLTGAQLIVRVGIGGDSVANDQLNNNMSGAQFDGNLVVCWFGAVAGGVKTLYVSTSKSPTKNIGSGSGSTAGWTTYSFSTTIDQYSGCGVAFTPSGRCILTYDTFSSGVRSAQYVTSDQFGEQSTWSSQAAMTPKVASILTSAIGRGVTAKVRTGK